MATPLDLIRKGIKSANWQLVCDGYTALTGEAIVPHAHAGGSWHALVMELRDKCNSMLEPAEKAYQEREAAKTEAVKPKKKSKAKEVAHKLAQRFAENGQLAGAPAGTKLPDLEPEPEPEPEDEYAKFRVQHNEPAQQVREDGKREARKLPFKPGMTNTFVDDGQLAAAESEFDKKVLPKAPSPRRPPVKMVTLKCSKCDRTEEVNPNAAPRRLSKDDERGSYICNSCIARAVK